MTKKLWGGRFRQPTSTLIERFTHSLVVDERLAPYDLKSSIAHARMLGNQRIIPPGTSRKLVQTLETLLRRWKQGKVSWDSQGEDIHTVIQMAVEKKAPEAAQYLHSARSRNDQVVTSLRLYCKETVGDLIENVRALQKAILTQAKRHQKLIMPGFTHLRHAQPVLVSHLLISYLEALERDRSRLTQAIHRLDALPLGSGALTGTGLAIDRKQVARELGFASILENSIDAVTSRDFVAEILSALSLLGLSLSRIAEDLILWSTPEFGFVSFEERLLTGSSMMPQKQNPDFLELIRGGASKVIGNLTGILTLLKGLSSGYQRDLQNDKELLFSALDRTQEMVQVLAHGFPGIHFHPKRLAAALEDESLYATDLAEYLVRKGIPFVQAHRAVGKLLAYVDHHHSTIRALPLKTIQQFHPKFQADLYRLVDPQAAVEAKRSLGSTHPAQVRTALTKWKHRLS